MFARKTRWSNDAIHSRDTVAADVFCDGVLF